MGILDRIRGAFVQGQEAFGYDFVLDPIDVDSGGPVTLAEARGLPGVGRGVDLVAGITSQLRWQALRRVDSGEVTTPQYPTPPLLLEPDPEGDLDQPSWFYAAAECLQWYGNTFALKTYGEPRGWQYPDWPSRLTMLEPDQVTWDPMHRQYVAYGVRQVDPAGMFHAKVGAWPMKRMGRGILDTYQHTLRVIRATEKAQFVVMNHGVPTGIISLTSPNVTTEQAKDFKDRFMESQRRRSVAVLANASFQNVQWDPNQMAMIPTREFHLRLAADMTGVPPYLLGVPAESRVYSNNETEWTNFIRITLGRILQPLQHQLSMCLPRTLQASANLEELQRADSKTRWEIHEVAHRIGAETVEEIRNTERMGPLPAGAAPDDDTVDTAPVGGPDES